MEKRRLLGLADQKVSEGRVEASVVWQGEAGGSLLNVILGDTMIVEVTDNQGVTMILEVTDNRGVTRSGSH